MLGLISPEKRGLWEDLVVALRYLKGLLGKMGTDWALLCQDLG